MKITAQRFWKPETDLPPWVPEKDTSYAAGAVIISANRGREPEILLLLQNKDDPEKISQRDERKGTYHREEMWKCPIGRFNPARHVDRGLDRDLWDTVKEEVIQEETGIQIDPERLRVAPLFEYRVPSKRVGSVFHLDRFSFLIIPERPLPNSEIYREQIELVTVRYFPLAEMPTGEGEADLHAGMSHSHLRHIIEFFEAPQSSNIKWQAGIRDDIGAVIRARFSTRGHRFPESFNSFSPSFPELRNA